MAPRQRNIIAPSTSFEESPDSSFFDDDDENDLAAIPSLISEQNDKVLSKQVKSKHSTTMKSSPKTLTTSAASSSKQKEANAVARDNHDYFNIVALAFVVFATAVNYEFPSGRYEGNYFWAMWATTMLYFVLDLSWVLAVPGCVKSPGVIVRHHVAAMLYLAAPIFYEQYRWLMGAVLSVELNTWFLICRRLVYRSHYRSGHAPVPPIVATTVSTLFYVTWIAIRCFLYPRVLLLFLSLWKDAIVESKGERYFFKELLFVPVHLALCILNLKWTYDLFNPIIGRWLQTTTIAAGRRRRPISAAAGVVVQDGL